MKATYKRPPGIKMPQAGSKFTGSAAEQSSCTVRRTAKSGANGQLPAKSR